MVIPFARLIHKLEVLIKYLYIFNKSQIPNGACPIDHTTSKQEALSPEVVKPGQSMTAGGPEPAPTHLFTSFPLHHSLT